MFNLWSKFPSAIDILKSYNTIAIHQYNVKPLTDNHEETSRDFLNKWSSNFKLVLLVAVQWRTFKSCRDSWELLHFTSPNKLRNILITSFPTNFKCKNIILTMFVIKNNGFILININQVTSNALLRRRRELRATLPTMDEICPTDTALPTLVGDVLPYRQQKHMHCFSGYKPIQSQMLNCCSS